jgi:hypothetical protein
VGQGGLPTCWTRSWRGVEMIPFFSTRGVLPAACVAMALLPTASTYSWMQMTGAPSLRPFSPRDIQIKRFVGEMAYLEITDWEYGDGMGLGLDPDKPARTVSQGDVSVRLFDAVTIDNESVTLKEYPSAAKALADADLAACKQLRDSWEARAARSGASPPFVWLMGSLVADESFASARFIEKWFSKFSSLIPPRPGNIWLVFTNDAPTTLASFPSAKQEAEFWDRFNPRGAFERRAAFVKHIMEGSVASLGFLHEAGIYHRSLGASSVRLTSVDERFPALAAVKLSDFGFSSRMGALDEETLALAKKCGASTNVAVANFLLGEDLRNLGFVFMELILRSFSIKSEEGTSSGSNLEEARPTEQAVLRRLVDDIFKGDVRIKFRGYCLEDDSWAEAVRFLDADDCAGWDLLQTLLMPGTKSLRSDAIMSARGLLSLPFFVK